MTEVTQADQDAADETIAALLPILPAQFDALPFRQALATANARHRTTAEAAKDARIAEMEAALKGLVEAYRCEADPYSLAGFYRNLDEDDAMRDALAALKEIDNG